ncbi:MAG: peptidase A24 [Deltaproteobacteria bacterium RIFOXYD12_FULL_50_9]|nr:MAG: peptidase A24 [Deltaproteobacteria bacterium RIFOXYD12_FULL_50_9]
MSTFFSVIATILGALVGSFLNVVILRLPEPGSSIVFPGSHCPACKAPIRWFDNIPVLSFLILGAKCRSCRQLISWQYPLVEIAMALLSFALYRKFLFTPLFLGYFLFCAALLAIIFIDFRLQIIPDRITLPGIVLGFGFSFINPQVTWSASGLGLLCGGGVLYLIAGGYYFITKREGMGFGDIKLLAMIGAFLGWQSLLFVIFFSSLLGTLVGIPAMIRQKKGGRTVIPYGPFLSLAAMAYLFFSETIVRLWQMFLLPAA